MDFRTSSYTFDGFFFTLYNIKFLKRKSSIGPLELLHISLLLSVIAGCSTQLLSTLMYIVAWFKGSHLELTEVSEAGGIVGTFTIIICRAIALVVNKTDMNRLLKELEELFSIIRLSLQKHHLRSFAEGIMLRNRVITNLYKYGSVAFALLPLVLSVFDWIIKGQQYRFRYPFISLYPFDQYTLRSYPLVYCFQIVVCCSGVHLLFNDDLIFATIVAQISMHYRNLSELLRKLDANIEAVNCQKLKTLIRYQYATESLRDEVDKIFSSSTFIGFTIMKITICLFVFAIFQGHDVVNKVRLALTILALIVPVYIRCSFGTDLYVSSESLIDALYDHNWFEGPVKHRKMIVMMMMRANRPVELQASKVNNVCIEYFKEIVKETYSFVMFLYKFSE